MEGSSMKKLTVSLLQLNGWAAVLIGSYIVLDPVTMLAPYGLQSDLSAGLMSELRAPGGLLLICGLMIARCGLNSALHTQGLMLSIAVYGGYGGARLLGFILDGQPPIEILVATTIELVLLVLSSAVIYKQKTVVRMALSR